jgi:phenylalanyl-tRNA synthetase alpha subunit
VLATALSIHLFKTGEGLLHACISSYVMRLIKNLRKRVKKQSDVITDDVLKVDEYETALSMWIKDEQLVIKRQSNFRNLRASLNLFADKDGSLRLKGRFANSSLKYEEQHSVLLRCKDCHFNYTVGYLGCT